MGFVERAFTPPGTGAYVPPPVSAAAAPTAAPTAPPPTPPTIPTPPATPPQFQIGSAPGARQRAQITGTTMLGAAATAPGQTARKSLLGQ